MTARKLLSGLPRICSIFVTLGVLSLLLLTGPVKAFILGLVISDSFVKEGEAISFAASIEIQSGEIIPVEQLEFDIIGRKNLSCIFYVNSSVISGCQGISIQQLSLPGIDYGYGYGYGYGYSYKEGNLSYNITLNTTGYPGGVYKTEFKIISKGEAFFKDGGSFMLKAANISEIKKCSVRAKEGKLEVTDKNYESSRNSLNFKIPLENSADGGGYLISQQNRNRFSYSFYTTDVLENTEDILIAWISGEYRINTGSKIKDSAILYLDKKNKKLSTFGQDFYAENMDVNFLVC